MKKILLFTFAALFISQEATSQTTAKSTAGGQPGYKTGIGIRFGWEGGLSVKHFLREKRAIEGILSTGWGYGGSRLTGLYEVHKPIAGVEGLDWFFGGGAHIGMYSGRYYGYYGYYNGGYYDNKGRWHPDGYRSRYMTLGIDGIIGLEYQFEDLPFTATLDFKPFIDIIGYGNRFSDGALTLRYIIK